TRALPVGGPPPTRTARLPNRRRRRLRAGKAALPREKGTPGPNSSSLDTTQGAASAMVKDTLQGFSQKLNPLAQKVSKQLTTVRQWGEEKIGVAQDITELPHEYLELEKVRRRGGVHGHTDALVRVHTALLKVTRTHQTPSYDYPAHLQETIADFSRSVGGKVIAGASGAMRDVAGGDASHQPSPTASLSPGVAKTLAHALGRACKEGAVALGDQEPFDWGCENKDGAILFGALTSHFPPNHPFQAALIAASHDQEITKQVYLPLSATLNSTLAHAMASRIYSRNPVLEDGASCTAAYVFSRN
ncbi:MAG: Bin/amphiphysin/Rvs domain for vesicular trafficking-domain-containing protein, partial [Olpidium bornovanus]